MSHDSINRFLLRERYKPKDLDESTLGEVTRQDLRQLCSIHWGIETNPSSFEAAL